MSRDLIPKNDTVVGHDPLGNTLKDVPDNFKKPEPGGKGIKGSADH